MLPKHQSQSAGLLVTGMCNSVCYIIYVFMSLERRICHVHTFAEEHKEGDHVELGICKKTPFVSKILLLLKFEKINI